MMASDAAWAQTATPRSCALSTVAATGDGDNALDRIVDLYCSKTAAWESTLREFALSLFWLLAGIEFAWSAMRLVFKGADLGEWLGELFFQIMFLGFFLLLLNESANWARAIVDSFRTAATAAARANGVDAGLAPSDIFDVGAQIATKFVESTSFWKPGASLGLLLAAILIVVVFALITAHVILGLIESYIVISASVLFMGFGGSRWTKDFATKVMVYAVSVGAKLFVVQLLIALGMQVFRELGDTMQTTNTSLFVIIGAALVMLVLVKIVPEMVQSLINGSSLASGNALVSTVVQSATLAAAAAISGGMAVGGAVKLASEQLAEAQTAGTAPRSAAGREAWRIGATVGNLARYSLGQIGDRFSGAARPRGTVLGQAALTMTEKANEKRKARTRTTSPAGDANSET